MTLNNVVIFGDSYSTFKGYIPEGYETYYSENERPETDVTRVSETWWYQVVEEKNLNLVLNNSWSGSTIGYTGYNNTDCSQSSSFIYRFERLLESGFFKENKIDTVFVFGGTNDSWCNAPLGALKYSDFKKEDLYSVLPAVSYFLKRLKEELPYSRIVCIINTNLKPEISTGMKNACAHYRIESIELQNIDKRGGHPTIKGMQDIKEQVI